jgi:eukaryotic-like serine/threonine-protein kinase
VTTSAPLLEPLRAILGHHYAIERELGRGGMGAVFLARDRRLDRPVALKVLPPEFARDTALRERFVRETRLVASFSHPNIVPVFAVEESDDLVAFAMGYIEGETLADRVRRAGPLAVREAVRLLQDIGYALAYAHGRGVVHRDIKPDNIMIERATGRALLMDFGISRTIDARSAPAGLTRVGEIVGTPEFMSPEQATGDVVDGRSDLYSLSLVAYYALTGQLAISGETTQRVLAQQLTEPVPSVNTVRGDVPPALAAVIDRCARKEPAERYATAEEMIEEIEAAQLAAPEVPAPIRQFAQELGAVSMAMFFGLVVLLLIWEIIKARNWSPMDALFEQSLVVAILIARLLQTRGRWRQLRAFGFDGTSVLDGFEQIAEERKATREAIRAQPVMVQRRRFVFWSAVALLPLSFVVERIAMESRVQVGPTLWDIPPYGIALFFLGNVMRGASLVMLISTPLRMPIGERLFRLMWLGPIGRWLLDGRDQKRVGRTIPPTLRPTPVAQPNTSIASPTAAPLSMEQVHQRLKALEEWRSSLG